MTRITDRRNQTLIRALATVFALLLLGVSAVTGADDKAAFFVQYDDGEADAFLGGPDGGAIDTWESVMLFDGVGGAGITLSGVDICWRQPASDPDVRYQLVGYRPDGPGGTPGTELFEIAAQATGITLGGTFDSVNLNLPLDGIPDLYIGVRWNPAVDPDIGFCSDRDGVDGLVQPAYTRWNDGGWMAHGTGAFDPSYNAHLFRALLTTPSPVLERLLIPGFTVDTTSGVGTTTLFAVRNLDSSTVGVDIEYYDIFGNLQRSDSVLLGPREAETVNVRDISGLSVDTLGFARGYVEVVTGNVSGAPPLLAGDYIHVDVGDNFATGERAVQLANGLCDRQSVRFLSFGDGTQLAIWIANPQGDGVGAPASFVVRAYNEAGAPVSGPVAVASDQNLVELEASDFTATAFGSLVFDFSASGGGTVFAEYSAEGRFSVGVDAQCEDAP
jgi:hypothetical protein